MKKFFTTILLLTTMAASACWFTQTNFNNTYIAGVNNYFAHYTETETVSEAKYMNGMTVAMPITVWVKVSPRISEVVPFSSMPIIKAVLQYKVLPSGSWITVKTYENPDWDLNFSKPVPLFGANCINESVANGTEILIRVYFSDGVCENGDLNADIVGSTVPNEAFLNSGGSYTGGWLAPHVMRVKISGIRPAR